MAQGQTTTSQLSAAPQEIYDRTMLIRVLDYLPHALFGQKKTIDLNSGTKPTFIVYDSLPLGVELAEGVNPDPQQLSRTQVQGELHTYGAYVEITEKVLLTTQDKTLTEAAKVLGENAGLTLDTVYRDELAGGTSVYRAGEVATRDEIATGPTYEELDAIILALRNNKAKPFTEIMNATTGVGTTPIPDAYWMITSFDGAEQIRKNLADAPFPYIPVEKYSSQAGVQRNEQGAYRNVRIIATTNAKIFEELGYDNADVHCGLIFGQNSYGITPLAAGNGLRNIVKPASVAGGPLEMYATSGWKGTTTCIILNDDFMYRYEFLLEDVVSGS